MNFRVGGLAYRLRFKQKEEEKQLLLLLHNIYVNNFFQVSFFFTQQPIWWWYNFATKNQLKHTIAHKTLDGAQAQESPNGYFCLAIMLIKINSQILGES
jgi:hypothetical protein